ncbi:MAG: arginase [Clostridium butyricum]|nr:arginase [Clostridium butyricum]
MMNTLLTIDWDYFMPYIHMMNTSYMENKSNIENHWYRMYLENKYSGRDITKIMRTADFLNGFWDKISDKFKINKNIKLIVSDSHKEAYYVAKEFECGEVYNIDAHTDLGYGGMESLNFELNCANWLGKLLKEHSVYKGDIVLSPYSMEEPEDFEEINHNFNIEYKSIDNIEKSTEIKAIHICRSGAWTAPWLDCEFQKFINEPSLQCEIRDLPNRVWDIDSINLAKQIECTLF